MEKRLIWSDERQGETHKQVAIVFTPTAIKTISTVGVKSDYGEKQECVFGLPLTAKFVRGYYDHLREKMILIFEDESFDEVAEGHLIPERAITYKYSQDT